jgi:hypothetical protein
VELRRVRSRLAAAEAARDWYRSRLSSPRIDGTREYDRARLSECEATVAGLARRLRALLAADRPLTRDACQDAPERP